MRRFMARVVLEASREVHRLVYDTLLCIMEERNVDETTMAAVQDAAKWVESTRDISSVLQLDVPSAESIHMFLNFDIESWCHNNDRSMKLTEFKRPDHYQAKIDRSEVNELIHRSSETFGGDVYHWGPKMLEQHPIERFWYKYAH